MIPVNSPLGSMIKRFVDLLIAAAGLLLLSPLFLVIAALIRAETPGPVFFRQVRVGRAARPFRICKFRTMRANAEAEGPEITLDDDQRVTRVGRFLRDHKLDELPQLINVLMGEMSLVGPRPELPTFVTSYNETERQLLDFRPGLTDPASVRFRNEGGLLADSEDPQEDYREVLLPEKARLSLEYQRSATVFSDLGVVLRTIRALLRPS